MDDNIIQRFINVIKAKIRPKDKKYSSANEYAFSQEEIRDLAKENKQKISELKQDIFSNHKEKKESLSITSLMKEEALSPVEGTMKIDTNITLDTLNGDDGEGLLEKVLVEDEKEANEVKEDVKEKVSLEKKEVNSYIDLSVENQAIIMDNWSKINTVQIDKDIMEGKELLNHNYTITYADEASRFIHKIRKEYEVVICYLIGFNNEKKGIPSKTIFSSKIDSEWKYLSNYIKVLEKIRSFKK